ncbi:hypothetical protein ONZ45_g9928 [Pleurotus djamor]|nr:hypothetical protein ONZ45_g9928 [Pleurotus djamor]
MPDISNALSFISNEFDIFTSLIWSDLNMTFIPCSVLAIAATREASATFINVARFLPWITTFLCFFNLSNQIVGVEEDRINKPWRPITSGKISLAGAKLRLVTVLACFLSVTLAIGRPTQEAMVWLLTTAFLSLTPLGHHWIGKNNIGMTLATWALQSGSYQTVATPPTQMKWFFMVIAVWAGCVANIQDLRDVKGDMAIGRKMLPIVFGEKRTRWIISAIFLPIAIIGTHAILSYRVLRGSCAEYDATTYKGLGLAYLLCTVIITPMWM